MRQIEAVVRGLGERGRAWRRLDPVRTGLAVLAALVTAILFVPVGPLARPVVQHLLVLPILMGLAGWAAVLGHRVTGLLGAGHPARRFWRGWSVACTLWAGASVVNVVTVVRDPLAATRPQQEPLFLLCLGVGSAVLVGVMLTYPLGIRSGRERACFWLDMATVMVCTAAFGAYTVLSAPPEQLANGVGYLLAGPVVLLVAVFAAAKLMISGSAPFSRAFGVITVVAALVGGIAQPLAAVLFAHGEGRWHVGLIALTHLLIVAATRVQQRRCQVGGADAFVRQRRPYSRLPYIAIAAAYLLLVATIANDGVAPRSMAVLAAAIASTTLVIARQLAAFADNAHLLKQLGTKVDELNHARTVLQAAVDERDALTDQLRSLAFYDSLTGLANRALFLDRAELALSRARRDGGNIVVIVVDLDDFKPVNDLLGHAAGDAVLAEVGARMRQHVRDTDTVARLGGDEFAILREGPEPLEPRAINDLAGRIITAVQDPIDTAGTQVTVGASVGVAQDRNGRSDVDRLLQAADAAMYAAKRRGKGTYGIADLELAVDGQAVDVAV